MGRTDPEALEAQIETARAQLADTIDALAERVAPRNVADRAKSRAKGFVVNADGSLKTDKVAIAGGAALLFVVIVVWRRFH